MIAKGGTSASKFYLGSSEVTKIYKGDTLVYGGTSPVLPYDAEVEYLQSDGNQYFTLPVAPSEATDAFQIEFRRTSNTAQQRFCHANGEATFQVYANGSSRVAYSRNGNWVAAWNGNNGALGVVKHTLKVDYYNRKVTYDCGTANISSTTKSASGNLVVTGPYNANAVFKGLIYGVKFWRSGVLKYDLIPVRKNGVGYFFDKVNEVLYANEGTGNWTIGYDKLTSLSSYTRLEYIQNTSTAATAPYLDTGVSSSAGSIDMEMTVKWDTIDSSMRQLMGCSYNPFWGCDAGAYKADGADMGLPTPSTSSYDTVTLTGATGQSSYPNSMSLFRAVTPTARAQTATTYICLCRLAGYKIWVDGGLVRNYVPVLHPAGVYGMFDNVENKFYASATSVGFSGG